MPIDDPLWDGEGCGVKKVFTLISRPLKILNIKDPSPMISVRNDKGLLVHYVDYACRRGALQGVCYIPPI